MEVKSMQGTTWNELFEDVEATVEQPVVVYHMNSMEKQRERNLKEEYIMT